MFVSLDSLPTEVSKTRSQWERELITDTEAIGRLLDCFVFALVDNPLESKRVGSILDLVPLPLLGKMIVSLESNRRADGDWTWPLGGPPLVNYGRGAPALKDRPPPRKIAEPNEVAAVCNLGELLSANQNKRQI